MSPQLTGLVLLLCTYLIGAIPFGYLLARAKGVDLFKEGSGNIGATNVGRVLGRGYGIVTFVLDLLKGILPVVLIHPLARLVDPEAINAWNVKDALRVGAAVLAFLGHLFPIYLGFRGGKGVATGAGTVLVLMPGPTLIAMLFWVTVVSASRTISLGSIAAVLALCVARLLSVANPFGPEDWLVTAYALCGTFLVIFKHRSNIVRLMKGSENRLDDSLRLQRACKVLHIVSLGVWLGSGTFFQAAALTIFATFQEVVRTAPSDRTAYLPLAPDATQDELKQLGSALGGAAVGPLFPSFFALQGICVAIALVTALRWIRLGEPVHRWRVLCLQFAALSVLIGWPIARKVTQLRLERFSPDPAVAESAKAAFGPWHAVSLGLSFATIALVLVTMILAARLPGESTPINRTAQ